MCDPDSPRCQACLEMHEPDGDEWTCPFDGDARACHQADEDDAAYDAWRDREVGR